MAQGHGGMGSSHHHSKGVGGAMLGGMHLGASEHHSGFDEHRVHNKNMAKMTSIDLRSSQTGPRDDPCPHTERVPLTCTGGSGDTRSLADMRQSAASRLGWTLEEYEVRLAAAKMIGGFVIRDKGSVELERGSVYGAVILIPQVARSAGWPRFFCSMAVRAYIFLFVNFVVQGGLLYMIAKEETVMDLFAGQMYLCDFGAFVQDCPGNPWCVGPTGSQISAPRTYSWSQWSSRQFVKTSLEALFPDRLDDIRKNVDPGEYGMESYSCRWLCCFIFMMSVMSELFLNFRMLRLLCAVPNENEPWLQLKDDDTEASSWLDAAEVRVAGMSPGWKIINIIFVFIPKMLLWKITAEAGVVFLMETASIEDIIVNSVALTFVLNIDEMFFELMSDAAKVMLECHEELKFYDETQEENLPEELIMEEHCVRQNLRHWRIWDTLELFPVKLVAVFLLTLWFAANYYVERCNYAGNAHWLSKDMYLPKSIHFSILSAYFSSFFPNPHLDEPFWQMPKIEHMQNASWRP